MKSFIQVIKNIWSIKELRDKLILTFSFLLVYRFGSYIPLPGIDINEVNRLIAEQAKSSNGILGLLNSFTGGSFNRASILALGIMPYISASIVVQLMGLAVPYIQKLQKEGESGRNKVNQITRWLTILVCVVQAPAYLTLLSTQLLPYGNGYQSAYLIAPDNFWFWFPATVILITGTVFAMWMGEKITDKGIGNGISLIIMVGILADFPKAVLNAFEVDPSNGIFFLIEMVGLVLVIMLCILITQAVRKVPVQYVRRAQASGNSSYFKSVTDSVRSYIPLKVNAAGVMPIIFAQAIMFLPAMLANFLLDENSSVRQFFQSMADPFTWQYNLIFGLLIVIFTFFYTAITIPVNQMADDLKRNGGIIPGIKPGKDTADYLDDVLSKITLPGALLLTLIAILPSLVRMLGVDQSLSMFFGGTSLLIMVGVILDTVQQINTYLLNNHYDGLMQSGRTSNRGVA